MNSAGKLNGIGVLERSPGNTCDSSCEGEFANGMEQGEWVLKFQSGARCEGDYLNGKKHGTWTEDLSNGAMEIEKFAGEKKTGH